MRQHHWTIRLILAASAIGAASLSAFAEPPAVEGPLDPLLALRDVADVDSIGRMRDWYVTHLADAPQAVRDEAALAIRAHMDAVVAAHIRVDGHKAGILMADASTDAEVEAYWHANKDRFARNGLVLYTLEGSELWCHVARNAPDEFLKPLIHTTGPEVSAFLGLHTDPLYTEGLLHLTLAQLFPYVAEYDAYLSAFPDSPRAPQVRSAYYDYLGALLTGGVLRANEFFDSHGNAQPTAVDALRSFVHAYPTSEAAGVVRQYLNLLHVHSFRYHTDLHEFVAKHAPPGFRWSAEAYFQSFYSETPQDPYYYDAEQLRREEQNTP